MPAQPASIPTKTPPNLRSQLKPEGQELLKDCVLVIGNFDGVHRGHQNLLENAQKIATENAKNGHTPALVALTFDPHPRMFLQAASGYNFYLSDPVLKAEYLFTHGVEQILTITFDNQCAQTSAQDFCRWVLQKASPKTIVVGYDFHFGAGREGDAKALQKIISDMCSKCQVHIINALADSWNEAYSSRRIRDMLRTGKMRDVISHLGHGWITRGEVIKGDARGRLLGYPTANIVLEDWTQPRYGVYAVRACVEAKDPDTGKITLSPWHWGVANFGIRPMFRIERPLLEVHLLDQNIDLYGEMLRVEWISYLRDEANFTSVESLVAQMDTDTSAARRALSSYQQNRGQGESRDKTS